MLCVCVQSLHVIFSSSGLGHWLTRNTSLCLRYAQSRNSNLSATLPFWHSGMLGRCWVGHAIGELDKKGGPMAGPMAPSVLDSAAFGIFVWSIWILHSALGFHSFPGGRDDMPKVVKALCLHIAAWTWKWHCNDMTWHEHEHHHDMTWLTQQLKVVEL